MFPLLLPSFSNLCRLVLKPPTQQFRQSSSTYLIMHHKRKQKFSLIGKPQQQNQARDGNLMIKRESHSLMLNEMIDLRISVETWLLRNFMFWHCVSLVRSVLFFHFPASVMKVRSSLLLVIYILFILTGKWSRGQWTPMLTENVTLSWVQMRHVCMNVKHSQEWWSEGKGSIKWMKHRDENGKRNAIRRWFLRVGTGCHLPFSRVFHSARALTPAKSTFAHIAIQYIISLPSARAKGILVLNIWWSNL